MIQNKYGSINADTQLNENSQDLRIYVYDENGKEVVGKEAIKKKMREIYREEHRLAKEDLIKIISGAYDTTDNYRMNHIIEATLLRFGVALYNSDGAMRSFGDVISEVSYMWSLWESDKE
jgi:hypothetical protein